MQLYSIDKDKVIQAYFLTGRVTYQYALENFVYLIDKLDIQRKFQNETFYKRLEIDFQKGCITPPITLAFIEDVDIDNVPKIAPVQAKIEDKIKSAFVLDGIQRLNTLRRVASHPNNELDLNQFLYINIIICPSRDNLLYRMVTLNNGQKPMTARHQIEILAESIYDFDSYDFEIVTEKENIDKKTKGFKKADILNAYISFLSNSTSLDNKKIIEDKLDELVARKIIEYKITDNTVDFTRILTLINRMYQSDALFDWLKNGNNLIGFAVGLRFSYEFVSGLSNNNLEELILKFETAFKKINVSKIKLSRERRRLSAYYFTHIHDFVNKDVDDLTLVFADQL